jgi:cell wall-associated NlpC family hydrolase
MQNYPPVASHVKVRRGIYSHHGIYVGYGQVIHHSGWSTGIFKKGPIEKAKWKEFLNGSKPELVPYKKTLDKERILENAISRLGDRAYNVFADNCEHFATWCMTGIHDSNQVNAFWRHGVIGILNAR